MCYLRLHGLLGLLGPSVLHGGLHGLPHEASQRGDLRRLDHGEAAWLLGDGGGDGVANTGVVEPVEVGVDLLGLGRGSSLRLLGNLGCLLLGALGGLELLGSLLLHLLLPALVEGDGLLALSRRGVPTSRLLAEESGGVLPLGKDALVLIVPDDAALTLGVVSRAGLVDAAHEQAEVLALLSEQARFLARLRELAVSSAELVVVLVAATLALCASPISPDAGHAAALGRKLLARPLGSTALALGSASALGICRLVGDRLHVLLMLLHEFEDVRLLLNGQRRVQGLVEALLRLDHLLGESLRCEGVENGELSVGEGRHRCCRVACKSL